MKYRKAIVFLLLISIMITLNGCNQDNNTDGLEGGSISDTDHIPSEGGEIFIPLTNFTTLNPLITDNANYYYFSKLIFEGIFEFDNNLKPTPQLAEEYFVSDNGRKIIINLKKNVKWHDGEEFTSADVAFTIDVIKYAGTESIYGRIFNNIGGIKEARIIDDNSIEIIFAQELGNNLEALTFPIIPKHVFYSGKGNSDYANALKTEDYVPIGTGPFKFNKYEKFKNLTLESNENFREGKPYINKVIGKVLENEELILTGFETGQLNIATALGVDWDKYKHNDRINVYEYISPDYEFIGFNFQNPIFNEAKGLAIRKAINYGIDRQSIIQKNHLGHSTQVDVPIHPNSWLASDYTHYYGYNKERAKEELSRAGFTIEDDNGILMDQEGNKLSFSMITNSYNPIRLKTALMIKEDLRKIGIEIKMDFDEKSKDTITKDMIESQWELINEKIVYGDFDLVLLGWELSLIPDLSFIFHSSAIEGANNFIKYNNEVMDELLDNIFMVSNELEKLALYEDIQKHIVEDLPYVSLHFRNKALLVDSKILGNLNPTFFNPYYGLKNCYIREDLQ